MENAGRKNPLTGLEIAVIGISGRFPGAESIDEFWNNLIKGKETITLFSNEELLESGIDPQLLKRSNYIRAKGYLENVEYFDASFFDYTPREARIMDPQIRLLHESSWEALENAGYDSEAFSGKIGFYGGASFNSGWMSAFPDPGDAPARMEAGSLCYKDSLSTLIAYKLNLKGPGLTLYTACSTGLVAIHQACRGLLTGECHMALAGAASVSIPKKNGYLYHPGMILSPDGHCRPFDANAGGTVFSDGAGVVALKRLDDAIRDGDFIYAVVKSSVVNNDGSRKAGYAAPSVEGQEEAVRGALLLAEIDPESITYIEAHGTGTAVGDPIEMEALTRVFNTGTKQYCALGAVKANVGHLDVASGMAGFIKTVLALTHRVIPPAIHFKTPNPEIDFHNSAFYVNTEPLSWGDPENPLRAGVGASGIGGTNAYVILEEAPISVSSEMSRGVHLLVLSARSTPALDAAAFNLTTHLKKSPRLNLADAAYTLHVGRRAFARRMAVLCRDNREAAEILEHRDPRGFFSGEHIDRSVIFMFPGQGTQYRHMAHELYRGEPVFKSHVDQCAQRVKSISGIDLIDIIYPRTGRNGADTTGSEEPLERTQVAQLALFVIEYALARLLMEWGIRPRGMIGHSIGEYVAACLSGVFSVEDALEIISIRGQLMEQTAEGAMMAVSLDEERILPFLGKENDLWLAAVNSPNLCVVSGTPTAVRRMEKRLTAKRCACIPLKARWAFHSGLLDDVLEPFKKVMETVALNPPQIPFMSSTTGRWISTREAVDPLYWVYHLRNTVYFSRGLRELFREPNRVFLEVGPGDTLKHLAGHHIPWDDRREIFTSLRRSDDHESDQVFLLKTLARLWVCGVTPDWENFYSHENRRRIPMPTYPFQRERYWFDQGPVKMKTTSPVLESSVPRIHPRSRLSAEYTPPSGKTEEIIAGIWEELFGIRPVGANDNFFELGGHSLSATVITSRVHRELDVHIPLKEIFAFPTVRRMAAYVEKAAGDIHYPVKPVEKREYYRQSSAQKRLYFLWQLAKEGTGYNMPVVRVVEGVLDREKCEETFRKLILRHESLRTSFFVVNGVPVQQIHEHAAFSVEYSGPARGEGTAPGLSTAIENMISDFVKPFDLSHAPLLRVSLVKLTSRRHLFFFDMHHIIADGASMEIFVREYMALYGGEPLPAISIQYKDFALRQIARKESGDFKKQEAYWVREFEGEVPVLNLPVDFPRSRTDLRGVDGNALEFEIGRIEFRAINRMAAAEGATLYMILLSIFNVLLARLSGQEDIVVGSPVAGRNHADIQQVFGMFVNTLALRSAPTGGKTFTHFLGEVRDRVLQDFENQDFQFEDLVEKVGVTHDRSRNPLFDVMFVLQNSGSPEIEMSGMKLRPYHYENRTSKFDLTLTAVEIDGLLHFRMRYSTQLFKKESIRRFIKYFKKIVTAVIAHPDTGISKIEIFTEEEKRRILEQFNGSDTDFPRDKTLHRLFEEQAARTPDHIALIGPIGLIRPIISICPMGMLSYRELDKKSNLLAHRLRQKGVGPGTVAAITAHRSVETVTGILGILKAGGAYLPIDTDYPDDRVNYMLADSGATILLRGIDVGNRLACSANSTATRAPGASGLAYIIYTSGTSGRPKGVMVEHRGAVNVVSWFGRTYRLGVGVNVLQMSNYTFDASVNQVFGSLLHGAALHVIEKDLITDIGGLRNYIDIHRITIINFVPMVLDQLLCRRPKAASLKIVISGGESLSDGTKDGILEKGYELYNHYGPTEVTIDTTASRCTGSKVDLGTPIPNIRCYILDKDRNPVPVGVAGELYIAGVGVARGYLNNPSLTAEKFVFLPFLPGERLYRSGDLVRWLQDPAARGPYKIEFLGRIDHQVKIRGCRIELGEIQTQILVDDAVKEVVVLDGESDEKYLCAYVVSDESLDLTRVKERLSRRLPAYMVPGYFVQVEKMPLTTTGKLDRNALPEPDARFRARYVPPGDEIEDKLVGIWAEVLGKRKEIIGRETNFFELGGHSLKATLLISKMHKAFDVRLPLEKVFMNPTVKELAYYIRTASPETYSAVEPAEKRSYYVLSSAQKRLYVLHRIDETGVAYNMLTVMVLEGALDRMKPERVFKTLIKRHESLRTSFDLMEGIPGPPEIVQRVHDAPDFGIEYYNLETGQPPGAGGGGVDRDIVRSFLEVDTMIRNFVRPFDLTRAPLLRAGLIRIEDRRHMLMVDMHHIISDGVSVERFVTEFMERYHGHPLRALKLQYKDYARWQESLRYIDTENTRKRELYWLEQFSGEIPRLDLPTDFPRSNLHRFVGGQKHFRLSASQTRALETLALEEGVSLYMVLLAVSYIFFARLGNREDIVIGTPTAGRPHADLLDIVGVFVNTLALRNYPSGRKTCKVFLGEVKQRTLGAFENQDYFFEDLVDGLAISRDISRNPLFDVMFSLQNFAMPKIELPELKLTPYPFDRGISLFDLSIIAEENEGRLRFVFEYSAELFEQETIHRFAGYFKHLLIGFAYNRDKRISRLELMSPAEKVQVLVHFNNTDTPYPAGLTIHRLFEEQVDGTPDHIALIDSLGALSYSVLDIQSNQMAHRLRENGLGPGAIAAVMTHRSMETVICIMAILKAGGVYLPIDPDYPRERIDYILKDSNASVHITSCRDAIYRVRIDCAGIAGGRDKSRPYRNRSHDAAYIIYTSGSSGTPRGVMVEHRSMVNRLWWMQRKYRFDSRDVVLQKTPFIFDVSVCETFRWIPGGGRLAVLPPGWETDPGGLIAFIRRNRVSIIEFVPSLLNAFLEYIDGFQRVRELSSLRLVFTGADVVGPRLVNKFNDLLFTANQTRLIDAYGPTEAAVDVTHFDCSTRLTVKDVPIGTPIGNTRVYILDEYGNPQPVGVVGQLHIAGVCLARGYLNNPEQTAEKFSRGAAPLRTSLLTLTPYPLPLTPLYSSGDLARWLPDGDIRFVGRKDRQIKIRGIRIELGEIENRLLNHPMITEAVVTAGVEKTGAGFLCAFLVVKSEENFREYLSRWLPVYMVPGRFIVIDKMPLTPGGKIDRRALLEHRGPEPRESGGGPVTGEEKALAEVWAEVLRIQPPGRNDNFFELGGDSIKAIQVAARLRNRGFFLKLSDLFLKPTIGLLAGYLRPPGSLTRRIAGKIEGDLPLTPIQKWFFQSARGDFNFYNQSVLLYRETGFDAAEVEKAFRRIAAHHDALRMVFLRNEASEIIQFNKGIKGFEIPVPIYDLRPGEEWEEDFREIGRRIRQDIDLSAGPLVKLGLFRTITGDYLLIVIHHLVVDGVSWRILLEDYAGTFTRSVEDRDIRFPGKTDSFKEWSLQLNRYAEGLEILEELDYWKALEAAVPDSLPRIPRHVTGRETADGRVIRTLELDEEQTRRLLRPVHRAYNTGNNDILLTALAMALNRWAGLETILINLEGHGREPIIQGIDITRTIGWFTSQFPVVLNIRKSGDVSSYIKDVKETLRRIPNKGVGYGILKYLTPVERKKGVSFQLEPEIGFNYLGELEPGGHRMPFEFASLKSGEPVSPEFRSRTLMDINGWITKGQLKMEVSFDLSLCPRDETPGGDFFQLFIDEFKDGLETVIRHCINKEQGELTPHDLTYSDLSINELDELKNKIEGIDG